MSLSKMLTRKPVSARPQDSVAEVAALMKTENVGAVVITEKTRPVGIVTDRDLAFAVCTGGCNPRDQVQSVMTCPVETISGDEGVYNATQRMMELALEREEVSNAWHSRGPICSASVAAHPRRRSRQYSCSRLSPSGTCRH